jgi:hypothetical protein
MVSLQTKNESLRPFLKNVMMDLSSPSRMMFLLLQKRWINSQRDSPFFYVMMAMSQLTPGHASMGESMTWKLIPRKARPWFDL